VPEKVTGSRQILAPTTLRVNNKGGEERERGNTMALAWFARGLLVIALVLSFYVWEVTEDGHGMLPVSESSTQRDSGTFPE
jgi:hypothetical protein